jgi:hypothetical protein
MKLRFIAREDALATVPGSRVNVGQSAHYVGRTYLAPKDGKGASYPATQEPHEATFDMSKQEDMARFNRYLKIAKRGDIWPADEATAKACGVDYVPASFKDGEWTRAAAAPAVPLHAPTPSAPASIAPHAPSHAPVDKPAEKRFGRKESE